MTKNEIVGRLKDGGLDASSTNRNAAVYVTDARNGRSEAGWFAYRIVCDSAETERRARAILSRWYDIETSGNVWRLKSKNRIPLMAIKRGAAPSTNGYMYLEAAQANSTVIMVSNLETAPNLEYSTDGETWQEWQHTTVDDTHTFDTITLTAIGDKVYFRGINPNGLADMSSSPFTSYHSTFILSGKIRCGGSVTSLIDNDGVTCTELPIYCYSGLFGNSFVQLDDDNSLLSAPSFGNVVEIGESACDNMFSGCKSLTTPSQMDKVQEIGKNGCSSMFKGCTSLTSAANMTDLTTIGENGCKSMYYGCTSLTSAANMPNLTTIGKNGCNLMYYGCTSLTLVSDGNLTFEFPTPPITTTDGTTYATAQDVANWMYGNL